MFIEQKQAVSGTLNAIALSDEFKDGTLRFSFSIENTKEEVDETIKALKRISTNASKICKKIKTTRKETVRK